MSTLSALLRPRLNSAPDQKPDKHCVSGWMVWKIGLSPFFVNSHTGSHFAQLLEFRYPEIFIQIQVAVVTLGRAGIGAEEVKRSPVRNHHRIAFQLHFHFFGEVDDVLFKDVGLCLTGGKENLVTSGKRGRQSGLHGQSKRSRRSGVTSAGCGCGWFFRLPTSGAGS